MHSFLIN